MRVRDNQLYLVVKLAVRLGTNWRAINAPNQLGSWPVTALWTADSARPTVTGGDRRLIPPPGGFYTTLDRSSDGTPSVSSVELGPQ